MIIYEITTKVKMELIKKYESYMLETHIPDLIETGYFESAEFARIAEGNYRVRYLAKGRETLEKYFESDAIRLRADFIEHFPEGVEVSREILEVLGEFIHAETRTK